MNTADVQMRGKTMFKAIGYTVVLALALSASGVHAQAGKKQSKPTAPATQPATPKGVAGIGKGDTEFGVFGNYTTFDDQDSDSLLIGASVGKFLSDSLQFRITPVIIYSETTIPGPSGGTSTNFTFSPFFSVEKLFRGATNGNPVVPFVGGGIGITLGYTDNPGPSYASTIGLLIGPTGGVKYFLSERASLELALSYQIGTVYISTETASSNGDIEIIRQDIRFNFYF